MDCTRSVCFCLVFRPLGAPALVRPRPRARARERETDTDTERETDRQTAGQGRRGSEGISPGCGTKSSAGPVSPPSPCSCLSARAPSLCHCRLARLADRGSRYSHRPSANLASRGPTNMAPSRKAIPGPTAVVHPTSQCHAPSVAPGAGASGALSSTRCHGMALHCDMAACAGAASCWASSRCSAALWCCSTRS